jgi:hypothetical protein
VSLYGRQAGAGAAGAQESFAASDKGTGMSMVFGCL